MAAEQRDERDEAGSVDVQATFCATLVDSWIALGLRHVVIAPGSRSTPLALQFAARPELRLHVAHDERSAAFIALGIGMADGLPAAVLCTSGTAATHFHAAVVESSLSNVPMIVLTADRPPELHDVGAAQSIDQQQLFGRSPRWFHDPGVPTVVTRPAWRRLAADAWARSLGHDPGPVHLNLPFRDPLVGTSGDLPGRSRDGWVRPQRTVSIDDLARLAEVTSSRCGVIVAGHGVDDPTAVGHLADVLGWPVLADTRSGCRVLPAAVGAFESVLRAEPFVGSHRPEVIVRLGEPPASKTLAQWAAASAAVQIQIDDSDRVFDPDHVVERRVAAPIGELCRGVAELLADAAPSAAPQRWTADWRAAAAAADRALDTAMPLAADDELDEPTIARLLTSGLLPAGTQLVVASSMPIRDVEWFGAAADGLTVHSNRGANGIDGVLATAIGVAVASARPTVVLLGDIAMCHDASSLTALATRGIDLTIVVVDNDGGGIFSFLPQASALEPAQFERLFGTPHGTDLVGLAAAHHLPACTVTTVGELAAAVRRSGADAVTNVVRVTSERDAHVAGHRRLHGLVSAALAAVTWDPVEP